MSGFMWLWNQNGGADVSSASSGFLGSGGGGWKSPLARNALSVSEDSFRRAFWIGRHGGSESESSEKSKDDNKAASSGGGNKRIRSAEVWLVVRMSDGAILGCTEAPGGGRDSADILHHLHLTDDDMSETDLALVPIEKLPVCNRMIAFNCPDKKWASPVKL